MKFTTKAWAQTQFQNFANKITSVFAKKTDIPSVGNGTLTIQKNGENVQTFTANQSGNITANITVPANAADVGAVATEKVLTTKEQINANMDASNVAGATAVKDMVGEINSNLTAQRFNLTRNPEHCTYDFSNCYRIGNIAVLSLYLDIRDIPQSYDKTLIATLPFKIKNAFPMETILSTGEGAIMYLDNNGDMGALLLNANGAAVDESAFLGQIVAVVE